MSKPGYVKESRYGFSVLTEDFKRIQKYNDYAPDHCFEKPCAVFTPLLTIKPENYHFSSIKRFYEGLKFIKSKFNEPVFKLWDADDNNAFNQSFHHIEAIIKAKSDERKKSVAVKKAGFVNIEEVIKSHDFIRQHELRKFILKHFPCKEANSITFVEFTTEKLVSHPNFSELLPHIYNPVLAFIEHFAANPGLIIASKF